MDKIYLISTIVLSSLGLVYFCFKVIITVIKNINYVGKELEKVFTRQTYAAIVRLTIYTTLFGVCLGLILSSISEEKFLGFVGGLGCIGMFCGIIYGIGYLIRAYLIKAMLTRLEK